MLQLSIPALILVGLAAFFLLSCIIRAYKADNNDKKEGLDDQIPLPKIITLYYADWCQYCKIFKKQTWNQVKSRISAQYPYVKFMEVNYEKSSSPADEPVNKFPTVYKRSVVNPKAPPIEYKGSIYSIADFENFVRKG